jgi:16S rRNA (guanine527-N7)-methyltransferase
MADDDLVRVLAEIQRRGAIGRTSLPAAIAHADRFVRAIPADASTLVDLGSGGGLPGLVIAHRRPDLTIALVERRSKRVDLLRFGIRALGCSRVTVYDGDVAEFAAGMAVPCDVVTARSFGSLPVVLAAAAPMLRRGGVVLVSEAPDVTAAATIRSSDFTDLGVTDSIRSLVFRRT